MTLTVHRAASTAALADGLAELLCDPLDDPFATEVVAVPAKGVERWLAQRLSHRLGAGPGRDDGICAGVRFLNPHSLVALVLGIERDDPWHPEQLAWPVLRALDASVTEGWAHTLATHLGHGVAGIEGELRRGRRYAVARRLAGLFSDYALQRPGMIADWRTGGQGDGLDGQVAADLSWQPHLWRLVLQQVGGEPPDVRLDRVVAALSADTHDAGDLDLPGRLSLFGHTRIARSEMAVIGALSEHREVHLWLPQSSPAAWDRLRNSASQGPVRRRDDDSGVIVQHSLLASLGRDARELQRTLALAPDREENALGARDTAPRTSLLGLLQADIAADHSPTAADRAARGIPIVDRSLQVHACHGTARQVDVVRDVLVDLLQRDPTLEPRDILVMCPDIDAFAPLLHAGFGLGESVRDATAHPAHELRVHLADRAPVHTNPLIGLAVRLVELAGGRLTASEVLDVVRTAPVRRRFALSEDDLDRISDWVASVVVRWGLDGEHRGDYQLAGLSQNTWAAGVDRILVGAAVDGVDVDHLGTTLALDDLDSADLELAGSLAELIDRLGSTLRAFRTATEVDSWVDALRDGVHGLADVPLADRWQAAAFDRELARIRAAATTSSGLTTLSLSDIRAMLTSQAGGRPTRSSFRTGTLTVCTMVPMRSVPHRVVALIGIDDGVFPRTTNPDGDDAMARSPMTGERDPRSEDRQLLLDAVMSATDTLVVTYAGFDEHSGQVRPPSVPLGELLDAVRATASGAGVDRLVTEHPLQPFDPRNLGAAPDGAAALLPDDRPFSHDPGALVGARSALGVRQDRVLLGGQQLAAADRAVVDLADLCRFFDNPAKAFLRDRLAMTLPYVPDLKGEGIPIELDSLELWGVADRILTAVLDGRDPMMVIDAELWRGELPPGMLGQRVLQGLLTKVQPVANRVWQVTGTTPGARLDRASIDIDIDLPSGRRLTGTIGDLVGGHAVAFSYSTLAAKHRIRSWILSLALSADGHGPATSHAIGRQSMATAGPHEPSAALEVLDRLIDLRDRGLREVVPLPPKTSLTWAQTWLRGIPNEPKADAAADKEWVGGNFPGERDDASWRHVLGDRAPLSDLTRARRTDEEWVPDVGGRLGQFALRLWTPILADGRERVTR